VQTSDLSEPDRDLAPSALSREFALRAETVVASKTASLEEFLDQAEAAGVLAEMLRQLALTAGLAGPGGPQFGRDLEYPGDLPMLEREVLRWYAVRLVDDCRMRYLVAHAALGTADAAVKDLSAPGRATLVWVLAHVAARVHTLAGGDDLLQAQRERHEAATRARGQRMVAGQAALVAAIIAARGRDVDATAGNVLTDLLAQDTRQTERVLLLWSNILADEGHTVPEGGDWIDEVARKFVLAAASSRPLPDEDWTALVWQATAKDARSIYTLCWRLALAVGTQR
jgi:hypothetical protein